MSPSPGVRGIPAYWVSSPAVPSAGRAARPPPLPVGGRSTKDHITKTLIALLYIFPSRKSITIQWLGRIFILKYRYSSLCNIEADKTNLFNFIELPLNLLAAEGMFVFPVDPISHDVAANQIKALVPAQTKRMVSDRSHGDYLITSESRDSI